MSGAECADRRRSAQITRDHDTALPRSPRSLTASRLQLTANRRPSTANRRRSIYDFSVMKHRLHRFCRVPCLAAFATWVCAFWVECRRQSFPFLLKDRRADGSHRSVGDPMRAGRAGVRQVLHEVLH